MMSCQAESWLGSLGVLIRQFQTVVPLQISNFLLVMGCRLKMSSMISTCIHQLNKDMKVEPPLLLKTAQIFRVIISHRMGHTECICTYGGFLILLSPILLIQHLTEMLM